LLLNAEMSNCSAISWREQVTLDEMMLNCICIVTLSVPMIYWL